MRIRKLLVAAVAAVAAATVTTVALAGASPAQAQSPRADTRRHPPGPGRRHRPRLVRLRPPRRRCGGGRADRRPRRPVRRPHGLPPERPRLPGAGGRPLRVPVLVLDEATILDKLVELETGAPGTLQTVILYHAVPGEIPSSTALSVPRAPS